MVAVGTEAATGVGSILVSLDGLNWSPGNAGTTNSLYAVACGQDGGGMALFVAVGAAGTILASQDGTNWVARDGGAWGNLVSATCGKGKVSQFIAVGTQESMARTPQAGAAE
ncbi:MAG: hypothetical protein ABSH34_33985 [Verrucomicrobiota bacterium]